MPVSSPLAPKSTLRHRPLGAQTKQQEPPRVARASRTHTQKPTPTTTVSGDIPTWKPARPLPSRRRQRLLLVGIGIGMIVAVVLVSLGQALIGWVGTTSDDLHYGRPRTFQTDAFVGHEAGTHPSHFLEVKWDKFYATCMPHTSLETGAMFSTTWASFPQLSPPLCIEDGG